MKQVHKKCGFCGKDYSKMERRDRPSRFCTKLCSQRWTAKNRSTTKGFIITKQGYKLLYLPGHPMAARNGYLMEHRFVMAEVLRRNLRQWEVVNHKNWNKMDNRPENLEVMNKKTHDRLPKPPPKPIKCPHCGKKIKVS